MNVKHRRDLDLMRRVIPVRKVIKDGYYHAGMKFINSRQFKDEEEAFLEEVTEFFINNLENIEDIERKINEESNSHDDSMDALTAALWTSNYAESARNAGNASDV